MPSQKNQTVAERRAAERERENRRILRRLQGRKNPVTAAQLNTTANRLRELGAVAIGTVKTGKAGRPAILFALPSEDEGQAARSGDSSAVTTQGGEPVDSVE